MILLHKKRILKVAALLFLPLFLLTCLISFSVVNPMGVSFLTSFEVVNATAQDLHVTPIGAVGPSGRRCTLPLSFFQALYVLRVDRSEFLIPAHTSRTFTYDWDDIQFSEILFRDPSGQYRLIPTGLPPTEGQYRRPPQTSFEISDVETAAAAAESHLAALQKGQKRGWIIYMLASLGLLSPICLWLARRR